MAKLGDVFTLIRNGASIKQTEGAGGFPITRIETIANREVDRKKFGYANIVDISKYEGYILQDGDILMSHINSEKHLGKVALYKKKGNEQIIHGMNLLLLRANPKILLPSYAAYYFETPAFLGQIQRITKKSVNQASFTVTALKEVGIPLPSLDNQRHIAAILDKVTDLIAQRRAQLDKLDLLVKSRFVEMFGDPIRNERNWPMVEIGDIAEIRIGPFGSLLHKEDYIKGGHALVNPSHIIDSQICVDENLTVSDEKYAELEPYHLKINDIVLGRRGEMGRCAVVHEEGLLCGTGSLIIRPKKEMKPYFLQSIISNPAYKKIIEDKSVGVTMMNLNVPIVSKLTVPKLPLPLQEQFIGILEKVNELKQPLTNSLQEQEILKNSLMQKYFE